jgi:purine-cytosine permease-like protein
MKVLNILHVTLTIVSLYLISVVIVLQLATLTGYTIIGAIVSGQTLSAISGNSLSLTVGIVIAAVASLVVSFMGYKVLHLYEKWSWIPTLAAIILTVGFGGSKLSQQAETATPTVRSILSFGSIIMSFTLSWSPLVSDFAVYVSPHVPRSVQIRLFLIMRAALFEYYS